MINASAVNALNPYSFEKCIAYEKNGCVTVVMKPGTTATQGEVIATGLPPSITGYDYKIRAGNTVNTTNRYFIIRTDGTLIVQQAITELTYPIMGMYQC